jgi:hypothetical protein
LRVIAYFSAKARGESPKRVPIDLILYQLAKEWNRPPWELKNAPAKDFYEYLELRRIEAKVNKDG